MPLFLQDCLVPKRIHILPVAMMPIHRELILLDQTRKQLVLPAGAVALDPIEGFGSTTKNPPLITCPSRTSFSLKQAARGRSEVDRLRRNGRVPEPP